MQLVMIRRRQNLKYVVDVFDSFEKIDPCYTFLFSYESLPSFSANYTCAIFLSDI